MTNATAVAKSEPEWAAYVAIDWADQKALLEIGASRQPAPGAGGIAEHAGGGGDLGRRLAAEVWRPPPRRLFGAGARSFDLYADQVRAPGAVSGAPHHRSTIPGNVLYFRCQGRS